MLVLSKVHYFQYLVLNLMFYVGLIGHYPSYIFMLNMMLYIELFGHYTSCLCDFSCSPM
uniref:Uncharacterized protein n=1 Tax=Triticum urartu TaxID=4572 RepID=A0A8R7JYH6_TRIUA